MLSTCFADAQSSADRKRGGDESIWTPEQKYAALKQRMASLERDRDRSLASSQILRVVANDRADAKHRRPCSPDHALTVPCFLGAPVIDDSKAETAKLQLNSVNESANALLLVSLAALAYGIWLLLANVHIEFHVWTGILCALLFLAAALAVALFLRFPAKLDVAFAATALVLGTVIGNHAFHALAGRSVVGIFDAKVVGKIEVSRRTATPAAHSGKDEFVSSQPAATRDANLIRETLVAAGIEDLATMRPAHALLPLVGLDRFLLFCP